ncbi:hypothetical protein P9112_013091 [Eukaryota sp. TZLM1-RC]
MWTKQTSQRTGQTYYFNRSTGQSQWEKPSDFEEPKQFHASHILVKHRESRRPSSWREKNITRSKEEALVILQDLKNKIDSSEASFAEIAKTYSDCGSAQNGGDLGLFSPGQMQAAFEEATSELKVGEISGPVWTDSGVHIILRHQ